MIAADFPSHRAEAVERAVRALADAAGEGVSDKCTVEEWIELPIDGAVQDTVSDGRFVDATRFGVGDCECLVARVLIGPVGQPLMQREEVRHEVALELLRILPS